MTLRSRLALVFFLLAVVPLAGLTIFGFVSSERAYQRAAEAEADKLARDMGVELETVTTDLDRRIARLGDLPISDLTAGQRLTNEIQAAVADKLRSALGAERLPFLESLEFKLDAETGDDVRTDDARSITIRLPELPAEVAPAMETARLALEHAQHAQKLAAAADRLKNLGEIIDQAVAGKPARAKGNRETRTEVGHGDERGRSSHRWTLDGPARLDGKRVGRYRAHVRKKRLLSTVLERTSRERGEIPFVIDDESRLHSPEQGRSTLDQLSVASRAGSVEGSVARRIGDWVVVYRRDRSSNVTLGIARPLGDGLRAIRSAAYRNFALGFGLVCLTLLGILPLSRRMTRDLSALTQGAERLASGDLDTRVRARSHDEIGRLAETFNRMARDLRTHQERLIEQERLRKELELGRRIQEELLPHCALRLAFGEVAGLSIPAREVGGDFFNYFALDEHTAALLVGDVSGKGVPAALLMANIQATIRALLPMQRDLKSLAERLDREIDLSIPPSTYITLFISLLDASDRQIHYVNAGHNPPLLLRADGTISELETTGRPLGLLAGGGYETRTLAVTSGDAIFIYTDGLVECENAHGEPFGRERLRDVVSSARDEPLDAVLARANEAVRTYRGAAEPLDDATMVVMRISIPSVIDAFTV
jgi:serine phosphatase RsbU (regulator of sigma subunit)